MKGRNIFLLSSKLLEKYITCILEIFKDITDSLLKYKFSENLNMELLVLVLTFDERSRHEIEAMVFFR